MGRLHLFIHLFITGLHCRCYQSTDRNLNMSKSAFTIPDWCKDNSISRAMFYKLAAEGLAPRTMKIGRKRLISVEAAADWRIQMEKNTQIMETK